MHNGLLHAHSGLRWVFLFFLVFTLASAIIKKSKYGKREQKLALITMIFAHIQLLIGVTLLFLTSKIHIGAASDIAKTQTRFFAMEHLLGMLLAIVLITVGRKKALLAATPEQSNKKIKILFGIALVIILVMIPWPFRTVLGGGWF